MTDSKDGEGNDLDKLLPDIDVVSLLSILITSDYITTIADL